MKVVEGLRRRRDVRRVHRLAGRAPVRRHHDRAAQRRVRGRDRHRPAPHAATSSSPTSPSSPAPATRPPTRLIGWAGKVLAEHPDQRRELVEDPSLIPNAIEELLRFEPPAPHVGRYVAKDVEFHGQTVPAGSAMLLLVGAANRDDRRYPDGDRFDIHREIGAAPHLRVRRALLPRRRAGPPRGSRRARRGAQALPGVGRRLVDRRRARADVDGAGLGDAAGARARDVPR